MLRSNNEKCAVSTLFFSPSLGLTSLTVLSGLVLGGSFVSADDVVDEINITVPISCTMSGIGMNTHNAEINNGTYQANIGTTTLHAFCNDNNGFAIYAAGYTGDEIGGTNSNKLVGTSASSNAVIDTGLATSAGNPDVSNWAMKLAITQDSGDTTGTNAYTIDSAPNTSGGPDASFSQYHVVPNEYTKVAHKNSATDMTANTGGVKLTTTYAAYISKTQPADTYTGQVIYTLVHPAEHAAPIVCNPNGTTIFTIVCMQDVNSSNKTSVIASMTEDAQYQLYDSRDEKQYYVAKLKDGNVWMTQDLDLDLDSTKTFTSDDTDIPSGTTWTPSASTVSGTDAFEETDTYPRSYDPGDVYWNGLYDWDAYENSCTVANDPSSCDESLKPGYALSGNTHYRVGNFYNWTAAIATNDSTDFQVYNQNANQSICPAGWTMPYGAWGSDFYNLGEYYPNTEPHFLPMYFNYAGSTKNDTGTGFYWTTISGLGYYAHFSIVQSSGFSASDEYSIYGLSVRCIIR